MEEDTEKIIEFLKEIEKMKYIDREIYLKHRKESDAEHSWHLAMFAILFEEKLPNEVDKLKILKMALIHDIPEIIAGDVFLFDEKAREGKEERERKAAEELFSKLPEKIGKEFTELFEEYNKAETKEAKFVKSFDKLQPFIQNLTVEENSWKKNNVKEADIDRMKKDLMRHEPFLMEIYEKLMKERQKKGFE